MTTHYGIKVAKWGDYNVAACQARGFRFPTGATSTDKDEVDCTRCAKKYGFEPKTKPESKNPNKTCACCFRDQKVKPVGSMFKHGYERPGYGYVVGGCPGDRFQPYEVSVEGTKYMLGLVETALEQALAHLEALKVAVTLQVAISVYIPVSERTSVARSYKTVLAPLHEGEEAKVFTDERGTRHYLRCFQEEREYQVKEQERRIKSIREDVVFFQTKIAEWKPA